MGIMMSDGASPKDVLDNLYIEAEGKAAKIRELKESIKKGE